jgi:hypothetical protein
MSDLWRVFSPISLDAMSELEAECDRLIDAYLASHPKSRDTFGELSASKSVPKEKEARAAYEKAGVAFPTALKTSLKACKSALMIERPGDLDRDPLQVSVLAFVLEHAEDALVAFEDAPYEPSVTVLVELSKKKTAAGFGTKAKGLPKTKNGGKVEIDRSMESVSQILETFEVAQHNLDLQIDLRRILGASSTLVKQYVTLLVNQGAVNDATAARALGVSVTEIEKVRQEVEAVTRSIRPADEASLEGAPPGEDGEAATDD